MKVLRWFPVRLLGQSIQGFMAEDRQVYVYFDDVCSLLGVNGNWLRRQILWDEAISDSLVTLRLDQSGFRKTPPVERDCFKSHALPYLLCTVDDSQVKPEHHLEFKRFRNRAAGAVKAAFGIQRLSRQGR